jgi:RsiW-degrading membrane proteinase PrsW (M82 family)
MKIKEVLLGIIIGVIFLMFCVFGTKLIYEIPKYDDYCNLSKFSPAINISNASEIQIQDNYYNECTNKYELANKNYSKNMFIISLIIGLLIIIFSVIFIEINSVSGGLMFGSLMFIIYGTSRYWNYMDDLLRFIILGISLGVLIYIAYLINKRNSKIEKRKR